MKTLVTITLTIALMSAAANANAVLEYEPFDLGGGLWQYTFTVSSDDGVDRSFAIENLVFSGNIQQLTYFFGPSELDVHVPSGAGFAAPPYDINKDTWVFDGWTPNPPNMNMPITNGFARGPGNGEDIVLSMGSGTTGVQSKGVAQIVALGDVDWQGTVFRNQQAFPTSGTASAGGGLDSIQILTPVTDDHPGGPYPTWNTVNIPAFGDTGQGNPPYGFGVTVDLSNVGAGVASYLVSVGEEDPANLGTYIFTPLQLVQDDDSPDGDGAADGTLDIFLSFAQLAAAGADDRTNATPYYIRVEAMDDTVAAGGGSQTGEVSEIEILIPEPATMGLMLFGAVGVLARKRRRN